MTTYLQSALDYIARGFSVIPIRHKSESGKEPAISAWKQYQQIAPSPAEIRAWFVRPNLDGLAIITGNASGGLTVRDFDVAEAYYRWSAAHPDLAATLPTVQTPRGFHVWCNSDARKTSEFADGEFRAGGVYVLAPPSQHPSGAVYSWLNPLPARGESLPFIQPELCGLVQCWLTEQSDRETEKTEPLLTASVSSVSSVASVGSVDSVGSVFSVCDQTSDLILATLPKRAGARNACIFDLTRRLKALPEHTDTDGKHLRPIVQEWHRLALPVIGTKPFDATWGDFLRAWKRVKFPKGDEPTAGIMERARSIKPPAWVCARFDCPMTRQLVVLCRELHRAAGGGIWYLACRTAASLINSEKTTAWSRLRLLEEEGVIHAKERGSVGGNRATRYVYIAEDAAL